MQGSQPKTKKDAHGKDGAGGLGGSAASIADGLARARVRVAHYAVPRCIELVDCGHRHWQAAWPTPCACA